MNMQINTTNIHSINLDVSEGGFKFVSTADMASDGPYLVLGIQSIRNKDETLTLIHSLESAKQMIAALETGLAKAEKLRKVCDKANKKS